MYRHTQTSPLALPLIGVAVTLVVWATLTGEGGDVGPVVLIVAVAVTLVSRLTVVMSDDAVTVSFVPGLIRRRISLRHILAARPLRSHWFWGVGIRVVPRGWMWNVWGFDVVELDLDSGRRFRIGTDEPRALAAALGRAGVPAVEHPRVIS